MPSVKKRTKTNNAEQAAQASLLAVAETVYINRFSGTYETPKESWSIAQLAEILSPDNDDEPEPEARRSVAYSRSATTSSTFHTRSVTPAAIAGVVCMPPRAFVSVWCT